MSKANNTLIRGCSPAERSAFPGEIRERGGGKQKISVIDLSQSGFKMHCMFLIPEDRMVFLTMQGLEPMEARIAWHRHDFYGCEFKRPCIRPCLNM